VLDLDAETDTVVIGLDHYSDLSEPGSPSAAATLDCAAAMASATIAAAEGTTTDDDSEFGMPPTL